MGKKNPVECFGCYGSTDDCFGCPVADECEDFTIECEIDEIDAEITKEEEGCVSDAYCPRCGHKLENYTLVEGGWCPKCREWFPADVVKESMEENE
jgi:hypothetical protein